MIIGAGKAVRTHLFVIAPNNSGSTLLRNAIASSPKVWSLAREGQHVPGFVGPSTRGTGTRLIWASRPEWIARFRAGPYDWAATRTAWHAQASAQSADASVFVTSSPPFLLNVAALREAFPDARFLFLTRNPYAAIEGILRRAAQQPIAPGEDIRAVAAWHMLKCLIEQRENIARHGQVGITFGYEEMCAAPASIAARISRLVPALDGFVWPDSVAVKGLPPARLQDGNAGQIALLSARDLRVITDIFDTAPGLIESFGFAIPTG